MTIAFVETAAPEPKSEQDHRGNNAAAKRVSRGAMVADKGRFFASAERWLRPADQLDYMIRRWLIPVSFEPNRLIASPVVAQTLGGASESNHHPAPLSGIGFLSLLRPSHLPTSLRLRSRWRNVPRSSFAG